MNKDQIGNFIKLLREEKGWTQEELATKIPVGRQAVSKWEKGKRIPDVDTLSKLSEIFNVSTDEILAGERNPKVDVSLTLLEDNNKILKKSYLLVFIIIILILIFLFYYFINQYKSERIYRISGISNKYNIKNGMVVVNKDKIYFMIGNVYNKINETKIDGLKLFYIDNNEENFIYQNDGDYIYFNDYLGYDEYFKTNKLNYILNNLYLKIYSEDKYEIMKVVATEDYVNDKLFFFKKNKIGLKDNDTSDNEKQNQETINKIKNKYHECEDNNYCYDKKDIHLVYIPDTDLIYTELNDKDIFIFDLDLNTLNYSNLDDSSQEFKVKCEESCKCDNDFCRKKSSEFFAIYNDSLK